MSGLSGDLAVTRSLSPNRYCGRFCAKNCGDDRGGLEVNWSDAVKDLQAQRNTASASDRGE